MINLYHIINYLNLMNRLNNITQILITYNNHIIRINLSIKYKNHQFINYQYKMPLLYKELILQKNY